MLLLLLRTDNVRCVVLKVGMACIQGTQDIWGSGQRIQYRDLFETLLLKARALKLCLMVISVVINMFLPAFCDLGALEYVIPLIMGVCEVKKNVAFSIWNVCHLSFCCSCFNQLHQCYVVLRTFQTEQFNISFGGVI